MYVQDVLNTVDSVHTITTLRSHDHFCGHNDRHTGNRDTIWPEGQDKIGHSMIWVLPVEVAVQEFPQQSRIL